LVAPSNLYATVLARLKAIEPTATFNVTYYTLTLDGSTEDTSGWYTSSFSEGATIEAIILTKAAQQLLVGMGIYIKTDATALTLTPVSEGGKIVDANGLTYKVITVKHHPYGNITVVYEADLNDVTDMENTA
jgi:hypothetical protein